MTKEKTQWQPLIVNIMADGNKAEDLTGYKVPKGHIFYNILNSEIIGKEVVS